MLITYSDFPVLDEKEENNRSLWGNLASFGVSSDEKHIVNIHCMTVDKGRFWAFVGNKDGEIKLIKARI